MINRDLVIIGGGPAGMAAALEARQQGISDILILERDSSLGGILNQCIHNGFGLHTFKEELTGPEYASRYESRIAEQNIEVWTNTMVISLDAGRHIQALNPQKGLVELKAKGVVLAMGCRERPRGALNIPGTRPAGIYSAGTAQYLVNIKNCMPGKRIVILGSGDIGLIMARRLSLEGAQVLAVAELLPYSGGLKRNIVQCLEDFDIPLLLSHTVVNVEGKQRVTGVTLAKVDTNRRPIPGTEIHYSCDTLLLSCGLLPENELSQSAGIELSALTGGAVVDESLMTSVPGIFACGNVLHVHDLVDYVSQEAAAAGRQAARWILNPVPIPEDEGLLQVQAGKGVRYTVPSRIHFSKAPERILLRFRSNGVYENAEIQACHQGNLLFRRKKKIVVPGEMEQIVLEKAALESLDPKEPLVISVERKEV